jgi:hypothetical protein
MNGNRNAKEVSFWRAVIQTVTTTDFVAMGVATCHFQVFEPTLRKMFFRKVPGREKVIFLFSPMTGHAGG